MLSVTARSYHACRPLLEAQGQSNAAEQEGRLVAIMTCTVCQTRHDYHFSKLAYSKGVVIVRCPGCSNHHLVADNLQWFSDEKKTLETMAAEMGINFQKGAVDADAAKQLRIPSTGGEGSEAQAQLSGGEATAPEAEERRLERENARLRMTGDTVEITK